ncbi:hypothetical protein L9F63_015537, partial [Diploptera punctata]
FSDPQIRTLSRLCVNFPAKLFLMTFRRLRPHPAQTFRNISSRSIVDSKLLELSFHINDFCPLTRFAPRCTICYRSLQRHISVFLHFFGLQVYNKIILNFDNVLLFSVVGPNWDFVIILTSDF